VRATARAADERNLAQPRERQGDAERACGAAEPPRRPARVVEEVRHRVNDAAMDELAVRVGDSERWAVDARLQAAVGDGLLSLPEYEQRSGAVWAARTRGELEAVSRDLPLPAPAPVPERAPATGKGRPRARRLLAVMSGDRLSGPLAPGQRVEAYALMGGAVVDLQRDDLPARIDVHAVAVMGGIEVLVPRGVEVHLSGLSLMGGRETSVDPPRPGAPVVTVQGFALMGAIEVKHGKEVTREAEEAVPPGASATLDMQKADAAAFPASSGSTAVEPHPGHRRRGRRLLLAAGLAALVLGGARADAVSVFGSTTAHAENYEHVRTATMFGSTTVIVPDDVQVDTGGVMVFGSTDCEAACGPHADSKGTIEIRNFGAFGSVEVLTQSEYDAQQAADAADD